MNETMTVRAVHPDMVRYLAEDCYTPGEIYERNGFSFLVFDPDLPCELVCDNADTGRLVFVATPRNGGGRPRAVIAWYDDRDGDNPEHRIVQATMYDATPNNVELMTMYANGKPAPSDRWFDEYEEGASVEDVRRLLSLSDGIVVCD